MYCYFFIHDVGYSKVHDNGYSKAHDDGSSSYPLSEIIEKEFDLKIKWVIDELPYQCKKILLLSRVDNILHKEIAEQLDISVNKVKSHVMNALNKLQSALEED